VTADEATYIIEDSGAQAVVTSRALLDTVGAVGGHLETPGLTLVTGQAAAGMETYEQAVAGSRSRTLSAETEGSFMFYSSGTTGRPKGIKLALTGQPFGSPQPSAQVLRRFFGFDSGTVYLEVFTFQPGLCSRLGLAPARGCRGRGPGTRAPALQRERLAQLRTEVPACGLAALNLWANPEPSRVLAGQSQTGRPHLCPVRAYHAAPLGGSMITQRLGGTVVIMERFDALDAAPDRAGGSGPAYLGHGSRSRRRRRGAGAGWPYGA
jgi:acyl-CoA synthetase (AMP-forming)/AMP-acid ligase II